MDDEKRILDGADVDFLFHDIDDGFKELYPDICFKALKNGTIVAKWTDGADGSLVHEKTFVPYDYLAEIIRGFFKDVKAHHQELPF